MPDNKAPCCVIETLIVLIIGIINMHRSGYKLADIFNRIVMNENIFVSILISSKFILQTV